MPGYIHLYTGNGKGKTTAAMGWHSELSVPVKESLLPSSSKECITQNLMH